jgi:hypothetical protein
MDYDAIYFRCILWRVVMDEQMKDLCNEVGVDFYQLYDKIDNAIRHGVVGDLTELTFQELMVCRAALEIAGGV